MTDQVQHLIDRIRKDAVQAAEQQRSELLAQARAQADALVAEANARAEAVRRDAEQHANAAVERGQRALQQAARDVVLQVGERVEHLVYDLLAESTAEAMRPQVIEEMLLRLAAGFAESGKAEGPIELCVGAAEREHLVQFVLERLRSQLEQGITLTVDPRLGRGFRLSYAAGAIHHDFSAQAVAQALAQLLRPQIGQIVLQAALAHDVGAGVS